jgi:hypothetical protein
MALNQKQRADLTYTIDHFQEIARQNRFAENNSIEHDVARCVICNPQLLPVDPFITYLEVITQSIKVRRPHLDDTLVAEINRDLELVGSPLRVSLAALRSAEEPAVELWRNWLRSAVETGLGLISIHSATSHEFDLDQAQEDGWGELIDTKIQELMAFQEEHS